MAHHPMFFSAFRGMYSDNGVDQMLVNYLLEHTYLWVWQDPLHAEFWNPPFFYPGRNVAAYSVTMLSYAPGYWAFRALGIAPDTSIQFWIITATAANYVAAYLLLRWVFKLNAVAASLGAFLYGFGALHVNEFERPHIIPEVYTIVAIAALIRIFARRDDSLLVRGMLWSCVALSLAAELWGAFYPGWFLALAMGVAACWATILPTYRRPFWRTLKADVPDHGRRLGAGRAGRPAYGCSLPRGGTELGRRGYFEVNMSLPDWRDWLFLGPQSWLYGWLHHLSPFHWLYMEQAHERGLGVVTTVVCVWGLWQVRHRPLTGLFGLVALTLWLVMMAYTRKHYFGLGILLLAATAGRLCGEPATVRQRVILGLTLALLGGYLFVFEVGGFEVVILAGAVGLGFALLALRFRAEARPALWRMAVAVVLVLAALATYLDYRESLIIGLGVPALGETLGLRSWRRLPPRALATAAVAYVAISPFVPEFFSPWYLVYAYLPGGGVIRLVGRLALLLLMAAGLGLASALDELNRRGRLRLAMVLAAIVIAEQGVTPLTYDKYAKRARVSQLAAAVDPQCVAFYYSPKARRRVAAQVHHVEAMWAGIQSHKPTINGYSGAAPTNWKPLAEAFVSDPESERGVRESLTVWARTHGLPLEGICWIGEGGVRLLLDRTGEGDQIKEEKGKEEEGDIVSPGRENLLPR